MLELNSKVNRKIDKGSLGGEIGKRCVWIGFGFHKFGEEKTAGHLTIPKGEREREKM